MHLTHAPRWQLSGNATKVRYVSGRTAVRITIWCTTCGAIKVRDLPGNLDNDEVEAIAFTRWGARCEDA